jgi:hypothetical protein
MASGSRAAVGLFAVAVVVALGAVAWLVFSGGPPVEVSKPSPDRPKPSPTRPDQPSPRPKPPRSDRSEPPKPRPTYDLVGQVLGPDGSPAPDADVIVYVSSREPVGQVRSAEPPVSEKVDPEILREIFSLTAEEATTTSWYTGVPVLPANEPTPAEAGRAKSGEDGRFSIKLKSRGPFRAEAQKEGLGHAVANDATAGGPPVVLRLGTAAVLKGRVLNGAGGAPVEGASVVLRSARVARSATTGADGTFSVADVAPGKYMLMAGAPGLAPAVLPAVEVPPPSGSVDVVLGSGCAIRVNAMKWEKPPAGWRRTPGNAYPPGPPVDGAVVVLYHPQTDTYRSAVTGGDGTARIDRLGPGIWRIGAKKEGFSIGYARDVRFVPGASPEESRDIRLLPAVETPLRILNEDGLPVRHAKIYSGGDDEDFDERTSRVIGTTDDDGVVKVTFDDGVPWKSVAWIVPEEGAVAKVEPEDPGSPAEQKVVVRPGRTIQGTVKDKAGQGVKNAKVYVEVTDDEKDIDVGLNTYTDAGGNYRFPSVPFGEVTIEAETDDGDWETVDVDETNRENPLVRDIRFEDEPTPPKAPVKKP